MSLQTSIMLEGIKKNLAFPVVWEIMRWEGVYLEDREGNISKEKIETWLEAFNVT